MGVEIVFADGDGSGTTEVAKDGKYADNNAYKVSDSELTATKSSCVVSDPYNGTTNPKRIPGATIRYTIEVENTSDSTDAEEVTVKDTLESTLDYNTSLVVKNADCDCLNQAITDKVGSGPDVTLDFGTVDKSTKACGYIEAIIK